MVLEKPLYERVAVIDVRPLFKVGTYDFLADPIKEVLKLEMLKAVAVVRYSPSNETKSVEIIDKEYVYLERILRDEMPPYFKIHDIIKLKLNWDAVAEKANEIAKRHNLHVILYLPSPSSAEVYFVVPKYRK